MEKISLSLILISTLAISGCVTGAKTVKPSSTEAGISAPKIIEKKSISATPTFSAYPVLEPVQEPVKIQYSQIANLISEFIDIKEENAVPGENSYSGISENKLTIIEIKGNKDDIREASIKLIYPKGIDKASAELNNAMMSRFLKNAAPELPDWDNRIKEILDKFYSMKIGVQGVVSENIELSNKIIQILYDRNADYIAATLKPQP